jgi:lipooligosaccharide transport system permease protein
MNYLKKVAAKYLTLAHAWSITGTFRMWQRNWKVFRKIFFKSMAPTFLEPLLYLGSLGIGLGLFVNEIQGVSYVNFIAPGLVASSTMFGSSYETTFNSFVRMRYEKVYDAILATPLTIEDIITGEILWGATRAFFYGTSFLAIITLLGLIKSPLAFLLLPFLFLSGILFGILGMTFTALIPEISLFSYYFTLFITPLFLFSGIFFPVEILPGWAQLLARFTPLFHIVRLSRNLIFGILNLATLSSGLVLVLTPLVLMPVPVLLMKKRLIK